ncbi:MAG: HD domain-containing phosphohydrolase [Pseudomonadota bacterium]|nr:HD domain-containing phosphohydrolase [Pseudomonadota bacterium]
METPNSVLDKAIKLAAITDRIDEIRTRFEVAKRASVAHVGLKRREWEPARDSHVWKRCLQTDQIIEHDAVVHSADPDNRYGFKIEAPAYKYNLGEIYNLCIARGTLTEEEWFKINDHIVQTNVMPESLPLPKNLENVPEIAGRHNEKMEGTGYPKKLEDGELSILEHIIVIADVSEALTASDRPCKLPKTLSESNRITILMMRDRHLDVELSKLFLNSGIYKDFAQNLLLDSLIDDVDINQYVALRIGFCRLNLVQ